MLRDALLSPDRFFRDRTRATLPRAALVVTLVALVSTLSIAGMGWYLGQQVDVTTQVDNPAYPGDAFCGDDAFATTMTGCDAPKTKTVDVGAKLWDEFAQRLPVVFLGSYATWLLFGALLHASSWFAGGEGSFSDTLVVTAWGMVPSILQTAVGIVLFYLSVRNADFATTPEALVQQFRTLTRTARGGNAVMTLPVTAWSWYVWSYGLKHRRNLSTGQATKAAGAVAVLVVVLDLL